MSRVHQAQEGWKLPDTKLWKSPILPRSLPPQGFPVFLQLNRVWVLCDHALNVKGQRVVCSLPLTTFPLSVQKLKQEADQFQ